MPTERDVTRIFYKVAPDALFRFQNEPELALEYALEWATWIAEFLEGRGMLSLEEEMIVAPKDKPSGDFDGLIELIAKTQFLTWLERGDKEAIRSFLGRLEKDFNVLTYEGPIAPPNEETADLPPVAPTINEAASDAL